MTFPLRVAGVARELLSHLGELSAVDVATGLASGLPGGIYTGAGIERYVGRGRCPIPTEATTSGCSTASCT